MLVRIINKWVYNDREFIPGDLVEMSPDLFQHVFDVSVAQEVKGVNEAKIFEAITTGMPISDNVKEKIAFQESETRFHFKLPVNVGEDKPRDFYYTVQKEPEGQTI